MTENEAKFEIIEHRPIIGFPKYVEALNIAINALEKQIPKKPISISSVENSMYVKCPTCKLRTVLYDGCSMDYCKNCGQKLNWESDAD